MFAPDHFYSALMAGRGVAVPPPMHTLQGPPTQTGVVTPEGLLSYLLPLGPPFVDLKLIHWSIQVSL